MLSAEAKPYNLKKNRSMWSYAQQVGLKKELEPHILRPVALDDSWKSSRWPKRMMEQIMEYDIIDFTGWEDDVKFEGMFRKLIDGLELFYKGLGQYGE